MFLDMFPETRVDPGLDIDRRYTTRETMALCMRIAGVEAWDLDVAADEESHWAPKWFGAEQDGLKQHWEGRVWCNPPYSDIEPWVRKAWSEADRGVMKTLAMLLPANRTEQPFWCEMVEPFRDGRWWHRLPVSSCPIGEMQRYSIDTHFLPTRVRFGHPGNRDAAGVGSPPFGCVLLVWGRQ